MENNKIAMMIVDDEVDVLKTFKEVFEPRGWTVFTAPTGSAALTIIEKEAISIVLLDIRLPDTSGIDLLKEIKKKRPDLPVVMVTALGYEDKLVEESIRCGASGYVSKAVSLTELVGAVDNALSK
jgi:DNA-binding NtrC family response regulator